MKKKSIKICLLVEIIGESGFRSSDEVYFFWVVVVVSIERVVMVSVFWRVVCRIRIGDGGDGKELQRRCSTGEPQGVFSGASFDSDGDDVFVLIAVKVAGINALKRVSKMAKVVDDEEVCFCASVVVVVVHDLVVLQLIVHNRTRRMAMIVSSNRNAHNKSFFVGHKLLC